VETGADDDDVDVDVAVDVEDELLPAEDDRALVDVGGASVVDGDDVLGVGTGVLAAGGSGAGAGAVEVVATAAPAEERVVTCVRGARADVVEEGVTPSGTA